MSNKLKVSKEGMLRARIVYLEALKREVNERNKGLLCIMDYQFTDEIDNEIRSLKLDLGIQDPLNRLIFRVIFGI